MAERGAKRKWVCPVCAGGVCRNAGCGGSSPSTAPSFYDPRGGGPCAAAALSPPRPAAAPPPLPPLMFTMKCASLQGPSRLVSAAHCSLYAPDKARIWHGTARNTATAASNALTILTEGARVAAQLKVPRLILYSNSAAVTKLITNPSTPNKSRTRRLVAALRRELAAFTHHVPPFSSTLPFAAEVDACRPLLTTRAPTTSTLVEPNVASARALRFLPSP